MNTYGDWTRRRAHNFYTGTLAEHGLLGALALAVAWLALCLARRHRWSLSTRKRMLQAVLFAYLLCGFQAENWFQLSFAIWLGAALELDDDPAPERGRAQSSGV